MFYGKAIGHSDVADRGGCLSDITLRKQKKEKCLDESVESEALSGRTRLSGCKIKLLRAQLKLRTLRTRLAVAFAGGHKY